MASLDLRSPNYAGIERTHANARTGGNYDVLGAVPGFWFDDVDAGGIGFLVTDAELVELPCETEAAGIGAKAYWDTTPGEVVKAESGNKLIGFFYEAKTATPTRCLIRLAGTAVAVGT